MENNSENKAKFFAQYLFQRVLMWHESSILYAIDGSDLAIVSTKKTDYFLVLKPLSSITDKDSTEVASILGIDNEAMVHHGKLFVNRLMGCRYGNSQDNCYLTLTSSWACEYLRSKGYALPFMGESIETLVNYGWIKMEVQNA